MMKATTSRAWTNTEWKRSRYSSGHDRSDSSYRSREDDYLKISTESGRVPSVPNPSLPCLGSESVAPPRPTPRGPWERKYFMTRATGPEDQRTTRPILIVNARYSTRHRYCHRYSRWLQQQTMQDE